LFYVIQLTLTISILQYVYIDITLCIVNRIMCKYEPIPFEQSKYIMISSSFFLVPASIFYYNRHYIYGHGLFVTSLVSMNYWYNVQYNSWRRYGDLLWSKIAFCMYFTLGIQTIPIKEQPIYIMVTIALIANYYVSNSLSIHHVKQYEWVWCHMIFHLLMTVNLYGIAQHV